MFLAELAMLEVSVPTQEFPAAEKGYRHSIIVLSCLQDCISKRIFIRVSISFSFGTLKDLILSLWLAYLHPALIPLQMKLPVETSRPTTNAPDPSLILSGNKLSNIH